MFCWLLSGFMLSIMSVKIFGESINDKEILLQVNWGKEESQLGYYPEERDKEDFLNPAEGPRSFAIDKEGNIYITDTLKNRVAKFDDKGKYLTSFGWFTGKAETTVITSSGRKVSFQYKSHFYPQVPLSILGRPCDIAADSAGNIYVTTIENDNYIFKFSSDGVLVALIDQFGPYFSRDIWGIDLKSTNDGGIMVGFAFKGKRMPYKRLFFDNNGNLLGEDIGQSDGSGKRYNVAPETKEAIVTGKERNEYSMEILDMEKKTKTRLALPFGNKTKDLWFVDIDQKGDLYFINPKDWIFLKVDNKGTVKSETRLLKYSAPMGMSKPYIISPAGEIYQMLPSNTGLQIIKTTAQ